MSVSFASLQRRLKMTAVATPGAGAIGNPKSEEPPKVTKFHAQGEEVTLKGTIVGATEDEKRCKVSFHVRDTGIPTVDAVIVEVDSVYLDDVVTPPAARKVEEKK